MPPKKPKKPKKPYPDFPLFAASNGQWAKQIRGKRFYFGVWAEPDAALEFYEKVRHDLYARRDPSPNRWYKFCGKYCEVDFAVGSEVDFDPRGVLDFPV
jgi:hypothetical protein